VLDPELVQTNILIFSLRGEGDVQALVGALARRGVLASTVGPNSIRLVTHHDVDRAACEQAAAILAEEIPKSA
jgi:threonine aldolase